MLFNPIIGGGIKLPSLTNPAAAADIMQNKQAIDQSGQIIVGTKAPLPILSNPGSAGDLLSGKQLIDQNGNALTGTIPSKGASNLSASGATVTVPAGYYPSQVSKSVATATQATPTISVSSSGLITTSSTQSAGYVSSGTKKATKQLTTQAGKTITPGTSQQTAVASGRYTTGAVYVAGDSDLKAENIKKGINIFGVAGSYEGATIEKEELSNANVIYQATVDETTIQISLLYAPIEILDFYICFLDGREELGAMLYLADASVDQAGFFTIRSGEFYLLGNIRFVISGSMITLTTIKNAVEDVVNLTTEVSGTAIYKR